MRFFGRTDAVTVTSDVDEKMVLYESLSIL
jgi:hypothetical protein